MKWQATVTYKDKDGKICIESRVYDLHVGSDGKIIELDRTRVIRDLVPPGGTTIRMTRRKVVG